MYQHQIKDLKSEILQNGGFEACSVLEDPYKGIRILGVRKIPNSINQGRHHLFVDLDDYRGLEYTCELNNALPFTFSKPLDEVGCHIDIYGKGNTFKIVGKDTYSQMLCALSANHTAQGHSSYYILATLEKLQPEPINEAKVYRIWNKRTGRYVGSLKNTEGYYTELLSAKRALAQCKSLKSVLVIVEYSLFLEGIIEE